MVIDHALIGLTIPAALTARHLLAVRMGEHVRRAWLRDLAVRLGAAGAVLMRRPGRSGARTRVHAAWGRPSAGRWHDLGLVPSMLERARDGGLLLIAGASGGHAPGVHGARGDADAGDAPERSGPRAAAIVLGCAGAGCDYIVLCWQRPIGPEAAVILARLAPRIARNWASGKIDVAAGASPRPPAAAPVAAPDVGSATGRRQAPAAEVEGGLLDMHNRAGLSRAEFRVCLALRERLSVREVSAELALSETTVRGHLRNIYRKTRTAGMGELVQRLRAHVDPVSRGRRQPG